MRSHRPRNTAHLTPQSLHLLPVGGAGKSRLVLPITPFYYLNCAATELPILPPGPNGSQEWTIIDWFKITCKCRHFYLWKCTLVSTWISLHTYRITCIENLKGEQGKKARLNLFCPGWSTTSSRLTGACSSQSTSSPTRQSDCFWVQPLVVRGQLGELIQGQAHSKCSYIDHHQNLRNFSLEGRKWVIRNCNKIN